MTAPATNAFDYQKLHTDLEGFFVAHPEVDPAATEEAKQAYALLQRAHGGVQQNAVDITTHHSETEQGRAEFHKEIQGLRAKIKKLQEGVKGGLEELHDDLTKPSKSEKLPDPEKYRGDRKTLRTFQRQLQIKLTANLDRFPTAAQQLAYSISRLEGPAADQFLVYITDEGIALDSMAEFFEILDNAFGDPDRAATSARNLREIRQRQRTFSDYFAEFQRYAADSEFNKAAKIECLLEGLNQDLMALMIQNETPTTIKDCGLLLQRLDNKQRALQARMGRFRFQIPSAPAPRPFAPRVPVAPATSPVVRGTPQPLPKSAAPAAHPSYTPGGAVPMDLSNSYRRPDPREREARRVENRCYYCGGVGHLVRDCKLSPSGRTAPRMRGALLEARKEKKEKEEEVLSEEEELKDSSLA